jgi:amino-acid N-acetyltransferase
MRPATGNEVREAGAGGMTGSTVTVSVRPKPTLTSAIDLLASADLPTEDLTEAHCEHFFFTGPASRPTGLVGLEIFDGVALLRSLVVTPESRGQGVGTALLEHAQDHARGRGARELYLLTTTAEKYFEKSGFVRAARAAAPAAISSTREFANICPSNSAFMVRQL